MRDERGVVISWLVKLLLGLAVFGVILFDAGSIIVNFFGLDSAADEIAVAVSTSVRSGEIAPNDRSSLETATKELAKEAKAKLVSVNVDQDGVLHVRLKRTAKTLIVGRIGPIKKWAKATADGRAGTK